MTDKEKAAMVWAEGELFGRWSNDGKGHIETIRAAFAAPRMPQELPAEAKKAMRAAFDAAYMHSDFIEAIYRALYAHLTKPATKEVEVERWGILWGDGGQMHPATFSTEGEALWASRNRPGVVIRLTGKATVPDQ